MILIGIGNIFRGMNIMYMSDSSLTILTTVWYGEIIMNLFYILLMENIKLITEDVRVL